MARVLLEIADPANRMTLKAILEAEGHEIASERPEAVITDDMAHAAAGALERPTLVLARANEIRDAVDAMRRGVFGYLFVPLQPGEAGLMVRRAIRAGRPEPLLETAPVSGTIEETEAQLILDTLKRAGNNRTEAARLLGIGRNTLWRKLRKIRDR